MMITQNNITDQNKPIIKKNKSIIVSCDVPTIAELTNLVKETCNIDGIGAYKIGFELVIPFGMKLVIKVIRKLTKLSVIYDHQKAGTDIPDTAKKFMQACKGVDAVILFPQAGPVTEEAWIKAAQEARMPVIIGGEMTHKGYLQSDDGFLADDMPDKVYLLASRLGVADFVIPGNKPERIIHYRKLLSNINPVFYSPGLVAQGGSLSEAAKVVGDKWHAIVGRAIYGAPDIKKAAEELCKIIKP